MRAAYILIIEYLFKSKQITVEYWHPKRVSVTIVPDDRDRVPFLDETLPAKTPPSLQSDSISDNPRCFATTQPTYMWEIAHLHLPWNNYKTKNFRQTVDEFQRVLFTIIYIYI